MKQQIKVALVQEKWTENPKEHLDNLEKAVHSAKHQGAELVCFHELTLSPYFCTRSDIDPKIYQEDLHEGPTSIFFGRLAKQYQIHITASLFEFAGFNTAVAYGTHGQMIAYTRKQHIPSGLKYHEDFYFKAGDSNYPVHNIAEIRTGLPTCYDQWFPELSRIYGLKNTELLIYPTAIGDEPTASEVDTQMAWQNVMVAQGIMNNLFVIAINRVGSEDGLNFYGGSFISSPMGEIIVQASRNQPEILVAELNMSIRTLWGRLFPFQQQRQAQTYEILVQQ